MRDIQLEITQKFITAIEAGISSTGWVRPWQRLATEGAAVNAKTAFSGVKCRKFIGLVANYGHAEGFEVFECKAEIEDTFGAGAHHRHGRLGQCQVWRPPP